MKRQAGSTSGQPPVKKTDASTDLRSKIGAKLQTLLNGIDTDSRLFARSRRQLYEDLFGKPKYSEIIIDPTIVIKTEAPDIEEDTNDSSTLLNSQNFLLTAKSRLTELLNKQQDGANKCKDSGKENTLYCNKNKSSSGKSNSSQNQQYKLQSRSCSSFNKKKNSSSKDYSNSSSDMIKNNEVHLKKLVVVLEDFMTSKNRTKFAHLLPVTHTDSCILSTNLEPSFISKQDDYLVSQDNILNEEANTGNLVFERSKSSGNSSNSEGCATENNLQSNESSEPVLLNYNPSQIIENYKVLTEGSIHHIPYCSENDSDVIDDPIIPQVIVDIKVGESISTDDSPNFETENPDSEVMLLCVKKPTHEVITLEDNDDVDILDEGIHVSDTKKDNADIGVIEEIHECKQCGKSFRAKSLLNFHIRMHGIPNRDG